jgi:hypothetical protein
VADQRVDVAIEHYSCSGLDLSSANSR